MSERHWVYQIGVPLPPGKTPADIPELAELEAHLDAALPPSDWIIKGTFIADTACERASLTDTLTWHRQRDNGTCTCDTAMVPAGSTPEVFAEHATRVFEDSVRVRTSPDTADLGSM